MYELKSCPFCGSKATIVHWNDGYRIGCIQTFVCRGGTNTSVAYPTVEEAVGAWNERQEQDGNRTEIY